MTLRLLPVTSQTQPSPVPTGRSQPEFSGLEWNALINRARSLLQALRECQAMQGSSPCKVCPMGKTDAQGRPEKRTAACRSNFRALEQRLAHLANLAPEPERQQLRRTVDGLHLAYRQLDPQEAPNDRNI